MDLTCFNTSGPFAQNASLLYDANNDEENLWQRNGSASLPPCSEPYSFLYQCLVCQVVDSVYVVCNNPTDGVKVILEGGSHPIETVRSDCPRVQIAAASSGELGIIIGIVSAIILFILAAIAIGVFLYRRHQRSLRGRNGSTTPGPSSSHEGNGLQQADKKLLPTDKNNTANGSPSPSVLCGDQHTGPAGGKRTPAARR
ncbi:uncharacterized protein PAE49_017179 isoform 3-T5 [Odontesthes bonariensis]|uniref:uncharacterized protein LOC142400831 isoform X3 n=1 Tax=Odontesthes bonariensis TaxID=219752 RepID=UPI003F5820BC